MNRLVSEAAVLSSFHKRIEIRQVVVPRLLPKQVLVRIIYASICGSQIFEWRGQRNNEKWLPHMFGHEAYGEVVEAEDCATWIKKGERVIVSWLTNGLETGEAPIYYDQEKNRINAGKCAIFSQYAVVTQDKIFRIPGNIDPRVAPLFGCSIPTGAGMVVLFSAGNSDSRVLVRGFGGVGMAASICLRKLGVREIFVDDISIERKEKSSAMGFSLLDSGAREESFTEIFDATGSISSIENSLAMLSAPGTLVFASHPPSGEKISIDPFELIRGKKIFGTWGGGINSQTLFDEIVNLLKQEILPEDFLGESFKLKDINRALDYSLSGQIGRALLVCD